MSSLSRLLKSVDEEAKARNRSYKWSMRISGTFFHAALATQVAFQQPVRGFLRRTWSSFWLALLLLVVAEASVACECSYSPLTEQKAKSASNAFAFKILSMNVGEEQHGRVVGAISVLENFRGDGRQYKTLEVQVGGCCGTALVVGKVYFGFTSASGPVFVANSGTVLEFSVPHAATALHEFTRKGIRKLLEGTESIPQSIWLDSQRKLAVDQTWLCSDE